MVIGQSEIPPLPGLSSSTDHAFRIKCLQQLHDALEREKESLRPLVVAEVGTPIMLTYAVQLGDAGKLDEGLKLAQAQIAGNLGGSTTPITTT